MISELTATAAAAGRDFMALGREARTGLMIDAAKALSDAAEEIYTVLGAETGLTEEWLRGELTRTVRQFEWFAELAGAGKHLPRATTFKVAPGNADIARTAVPIGVVAVFGASNFPLALGVTGSDTAGALAAGCPVIARAHPDQPRTSRLLARLLNRALPPGLVTLLEGDNATALELVRDPRVKAVGFTGSRAGGRAIMDAAAARPDPIRVYAEMGSLNPVFVLPGAAAKPDWVDALVTSATTSAGQLCTKPGLVVVPDDAEGEAFAAALAKRLAAVAIAQPMLNERMAAAHASWLDRARELSGVTVTAGRPEGGKDTRASATGKPGGPGTGAAIAEQPGCGPLSDAATAAAPDRPIPFVLGTTAATLSGELLEEHFGPTLVTCRADPAGYTGILSRLDGQLTATLLGAETDRALARELLPRLAEHAGRLIWNGMPTGVAVCEAMVHGGPWPAASAPGSTSIGSASIDRFLRPVALQGMPHWLDLGA